MDPGIFRRNLIIGQIFTFLQKQNKTGRHWLDDFKSLSEINQCNCDLECPKTKAFRVCCNIEASNLFSPLSLFHFVTFMWYSLTVSTRRALKMRKSFFCLRSLLRRPSATLRPDSGGRPGPPDTRKTKRVLRMEEEGGKQTNKLSKDNSSSVHSWFHDFHHQVCTLV